MMFVLLQNRFRRESNINNLAIALLSVFSVYVIVIPFFYFKNVRTSTTMPLSTSLIKLLKTTNICSNLSVLFLLTTNFSN